ncbi:MAG: MBL fold metallo-hydrolase [Myxococcales bacterium]|nr:MBL fold metallo-hydrolase [Myxococcales bacterium]
MRVDVWGVRGSIPAPGPTTNRYGGNTPCVSVIDTKGHLCVIDMGTGIVPLGTALLQKSLPVRDDFGAGKGNATVLLSHGHWDHIQGFPFFAPVFIPGTKLSIFGNARTADRVEALLEGQMNPQFSPIYTLKNLGATIRFEGVREHQCFRVSDLEVSSMELPHGETSVLSFQIKEQGKTLIYASDAGYSASGAPDDVVEFYRDADVLIHDSTYTPEEQELRRNRGLSSYLDAAAVAARAGVGKLVLFHYDQDHSDDIVDENVRLCGQELERLGAGRTEVVGAFEGMQIDI